MDDARSEIIDLDPEPAPRRAGLRWERILGVVLLLVVLGFAVADWAQREQQGRLYREAQTAQTAHHWDAARAAYAALGSYSDAPQRLATVQAEINHRDLLIAQATGATSPLIIWRNLQEASAIEPDYPGLAARLATARRALFYGGAAGLIYLQKTTTQAGLFLTRAAGSASYLPGSDNDSRVRGVAPGGRLFLYDARSRPGDECGPPCPPTARRLVLARLDEVGTLTTRLLASTLDPGGKGQFTDDATGIWWEVNGGTRYLDLASNQVTDLTRPGQNRWVLALDPAHKRVLLVNALPDTTAGTLYLAAADGHDEQIVAAAVSGNEVLDAAFSPQGPYLVLITQQRTSDLIQTLWLFDLTTDRAVVLDAIHSDGVQPTRLNAFFLPGAEPQRVLVNHLDEQGEWLSLYTLPGETSTLLWSGPALMRRYEAAAVSPDSLTLAVHSQVGNSGDFALLSLDGSQPPRTFPSPSFNGQQVNAMFSPAGDYVVYEILNPDGISRGYTKPLYSLPNGLSDGMAPRRIGIAVMPYDSTLPALAMPSGGDVLGYVSGAGELWATTFDGVGSERLVDRGVSAVWSLRDTRARTWLR
jgi:hypothetical protein